MKSVNANVYSKMSEIPISNIHPEGWMKDFLIRQKNGLTGNLDKIGFPFNEISWGAPEIDTTGKNVNPGWWVYEQTAYHLDGIERCGALLNDEELLAKAKKSFDYVLANADTDDVLVGKGFQDHFHFFGDTVCQNVPGESFFNRGFAAVEQLPVGLAQHILYTSGKKGDTQGTQVGAIQLQHDPLTPVAGRGLPGFYHQFFFQQICDNIAYGGGTVIRQCHQLGPADRPEMVDHIQNQ